MDEGRREWPFPEGRPGGLPEAGAGPEGAGPDGGGAAFEPRGGEAAAMAAQGQLGREHQGITLRGSAELVAEFFCEGAAGVSGTAPREREGGREGGLGGKAREGGRPRLVGRRGRRLGRGRGSVVHIAFPSPSESRSLWDQQHPVPAGHLPPRDLHPRAEVRADAAGHHGPGPGQLPQQRDGADERCGPAAGSSRPCPCRRSRSK